MTAPQETGPDVEVRAYARQVRAALADVPAGRLAELVDDLEEHLIEVAAEGGEPLVVRLGPAAEYAAELRRAAGLAEPAGSAEPAGRPGTRLRGEFAAGIDRLQASPLYRAVHDFLPELRPAWWVLRAWAPLVAVDAVLFGRTSFPVPSLGLSPLVGLVVTGAVITWSVRRGMQVREDPGLARPRLALAANAALAALALVALVAVADQPEPAMAYSSYTEPGATALSHEDGTPITNIHPYSATGEPLEGVLLYDQDGRPIDNVASYADDGGEVQRLDVVPPAPANAFPQAQRVPAWDEYGNPVWDENGDQIWIEQRPEPTPSAVPDRDDDGLPAPGDVLPAPEGTPAPTLPVEPAP